MHTMLQSMNQNLGKVALKLLTMIRKSSLGQVFEQIIFRISRKRRAFRKPFSHFSQKVKTYISILSNMFPVSDTLID